MRSRHRRVAEIKEVRNSDFEAWQSRLWENNSSAFVHYVAPNPSILRSTFLLPLLGSLPRAKFRAKIRAPKPLKTVCFQRPWWLAAGRHDSRFLRLVEQAIPQLAA
jgi:hypothetical protein